MMGDTHRDPSDRYRTTQPRAGLTLKDNLLWPGLILFAVAVAGLICTVALAAYGHHDWVMTTVVISALATLAGALWFVVELRYVTHIEKRWTSHH
ncbi:MULTISPECIES: protein UsfY [unclassified Mycobacterium]|uniref:protein UsfY n=2 Tax=Mycobacterium TaxID=1763 RepID=UPI00274290F3|nr:MULTISPECIES: protein UsfY [unclassified Mycobacterium]